MRHKDYTRKMQKMSDCLQSILHVLERERRASWQRNSTTTDTNTLLDMRESIKVTAREGTAALCNYSMTLQGIVNEHAAMTSYLEDEEIIRIDEETGESWYWVESGDQVEDGY